MVKEIKQISTTNQWTQCQSRNGVGKSAPTAGTPNEKTTTPQYRDRVSLDITKLVRYIGTIMAGAKEILRERSVKVVRDVTSTEMRIAGEGFAVGIAAEKIVFHRDLAGAGGAALAGAIIWGIQKYVSSRVEDKKMSPNSP